MKVSSPPSPPVDFRGLLAALPGVGPGDDVVVAAARHLLAFPVTEGLHRGEGGYRLVDRLMAEAARRLSIEVVRVDVDVGTRLARLYTRAGGFLLKIRRDVPQTTFRFATAHELAHALAYDRSHPEPRRYFANSRVEEKLCDRIALHILTPEELLGRRLGAVFPSPAGFDGDEAVGVSEEWGVTLWHVVRRVLERRDFERTVAVLWIREETDILRVGDYMAPRGLFVPLKDRSIRGERCNQLPWEVIDTSRLASGVDHASLGSIRGRMASVSFPGREKSRECVVQIIDLDDFHLGRVVRWRKKHRLGSYLTR